MTSDNTQQKLRMHALEDQTDHCRQHLQEDSLIEMPSTITPVFEVAKLLATWPEPVARTCARCSLHLACASTDVVADRHTHGS